MNSNYIRDFNFIAKTINEWCGIVIDKSKEYLICTRLNDIMHQNKCSSYDELLILAINEKTPFLKQKIIECMTTNETYFFRDTIMFEDLKEYGFNKIIKMKNENPLKNLMIRILNLGCSTGQESYSIAMTIQEFINKNSNLQISLNNFRIISVDVDNNVLNKAKEGVYNEFEINRGLKPIYLEKYFEKTGKNWKINDELKKIITFHQGNIANGFSFNGKYELIFCRNVLIYFSLEKKLEILKKIGSMFSFTGGYLIIGESENLYDLNSGFKIEKFGKTNFYYI
ncbi:MAG TPA: protein-glutamate O-methyltransferase CheR [bacterium]|nr:protein-glutamate O-methyltransferase CheR [bacterium]HPN31132.1 protein-glutamate O-methyltransferase CheR [bacterium]